MRTTTPGVPGAAAVFPRPRPLKGHPHIPALPAPQRSPPSFPAAAAAMPEDHDWEAYKVPPTRTPVSERTTSVPNPVNFFQSAFGYVLDAPVTFVRGTGGTRPPPCPPLPSPPGS